MAIRTALAEFDGTQLYDGDFPYVDVTWDVAIDVDQDFIILVGTLAASPIDCWVKAGSEDETGCRVLAVDQFTGTVSLTAVPV